MGRKSNKDIVADLFDKLNTEERQELISRWTSEKPEITYETIEPLFDRLCPECGSADHRKKGKTSQGLTVFKCNSCGRQFNILSETPLEKTRYKLTVWLSILEGMLNNKSIEDIHSNLISNHIVNDINIGTVSAMCQKLRNSFIYVPLPELNGIIQVDEKHFRESQKGSVSLVDVLDTTSTRKPHERATRSKYGTMGPEFSTICCAVDDTGHSVAKVVRMGHMRIDDFEDEIAPHFGKISYLCSDMNPVYYEWSSLNKVAHYVMNSEYHKIIVTCDTPAKKQAAYEQNKLEYVIGAGVMSYQQMVKFRIANNLTINAVNSYHSHLENYINHVAKGVSTKHLQSWVSFFNYRNNFRVDYGHRPISSEDAELVLMDILRVRQPITVSDIKTMVDETKRQPKRYTKKFLEKLMNARIKSNDPNLKFTEEDGVWIVDKRKTINALPEYKRRLLAKSLGIKPFSPIAVTSSDLKKKLLAHPDIEDVLYKLANGLDDIRDV